MNKDFERLRSIAGAEVMTWDVNRLPFAAAESKGPLTVWREGQVVRRFRWWHHPRLMDGKLQITDPRMHMRVIAEYDRGAWDEVSHDQSLAGRL
jgi:hypothetical protein